MKHMQEPNKMAKTGLLIVWWLVFGLCLYSEENRIAALHRTIGGLEKIPVPAGPDAVVVPEAAKTLIATLKHQLRDYIGATLNESEFLSRPEEAGERIVERLIESGILRKPGDAKESPEAHADDSFHYGTVSEVALRRVAGHPGLAAATCTLLIPYGSDTSLYLFQKFSSGWLIIFRDESKPYESIAEAFHEFAYRISPNGKDGSFFVLTVHFSSWFVSNWRSIRYQVSWFDSRRFTEKDENFTCIRKSAGDGIYCNSGVQELLSATDTIFFPSGFQIQVGRRSFTLRFRGGAQTKFDDASPLHKTIRGTIHGGRRIVVDHLYSEK